MISIEKGDFRFEISDAKRPTDVAKIFLPEEQYETSFNEIANKTKGKMLYCLKLLKVMEQACREIRLKQRKANRVVETTKIYREKVVEVVDDFVYFNRKKLEMKDLKGEIMQIDSTIQTDTEQSIGSGDSSDSYVTGSEKSNKKSYPETDSNSNSISSQESDRTASDKSSPLSKDEQEVSDKNIKLSEKGKVESVNKENSELDNPDGSLNLRLAEQLLKQSGKRQEIEILE